MNSAHEQAELPPSPDELLAMAYADNELDAVQRAQFEARLAREPSLAREVADQLRLGMLARSVAPPEPEDHEWARMARSPLRKLGFYVAWIAILAGALGSLCLGEIELVRSNCPIELKWSLSLLVGGLLLLLLLVARGRMRARVFDPYTEIKR